MSSPPPTQTVPTDPATAQEALDGEVWVTDSELLGTIFQVVFERATWSGDRRTREGMQLFSHTLSSWTV